MITSYLIGLCLIFGLTFIAGFGLMINGYRRYDFNPLVFIAPFFANGLLCFPIYFLLKGRYLRNNGTSAEELKCTRRCAVLGWVFFVAVIVVSFAMGVWFFVEKFDALNSGADGADIEAVIWGARLFWGNLAVCTVYGVSLASMCCRCKKERAGHGSDENIGELVQNAE